MTVSVHLNKWGMGTAAALLLLVGGVLFFNVDAASTSYAGRVPSQSEAEKFWAEQIRENGGELAYEIFSKIIARESQADKHLQAHFFGASLYDVEGANGILVCDEEYGYGCFHQFLGHAIADLGISAVGRLNEECFKGIGSRPLACQHAIGHGILAYFGYERTNLSEALAVCRDLPYIDPGEGCYGGVFMEYNIRSVLAPDTPAREFTGNISEPCDSVEDRYKSKCVYWLPQWWWETNFSDESGEVAFRHLGDYCDASVSSSELLESCYRGIGLAALQIAKHDPVSVRRLCLAASENAAHSLECLSRAAHILGEVLNERTAVRVCDEVSARMREYCLAYARDEANPLFKRALPKHI